MANDNPTAPIKPSAETGEMITILSEHTGWSKAAVLAEAMDHYYAIGMALPPAPKRGQRPTT